MNIEHQKFICSFLVLYVMEQTSISALFPVTGENSDYGDILAVGTSRKELTKL